MKTLKPTKKLACLAIIYLSLISSFGLFAQPSASATDARVLNDGPTYLLAWNIASTPNNYLIIVKKGSAETQLPSDGVTYNAGQSFGGGTVFAIRSGGSTQYSFAKGALPDAGQDYYLTIYPYNTSGGTKYRTTSPGIAIFVKPGLVQTQPSQTSNLVLTEGTKNESSQNVNYTFTGSSVEESIPFETRYFVVVKFGSAPNYVPQDGALATTSSSLVSLGNSEFGFLASGTSSSIGLTLSEEERTLFVKVYSLNKISSSIYTENFGAVTGSTNFNTTNPASASFVVEATAAEGPVIEDQKFPLIGSLQNGDIIGQIQAIDNRGEGLTYSLVSENVENAFLLEESTGILRINNINVYDPRAFFDLNFIATSTLRIEVSDGINTDEATIRVVTNIRPGFAGAAFSTDYSFDENTSWSVPLAVFNEGDEELTLSIISPGGDKLQIVRSDEPFAEFDWVLSPQDQSGGIDFESNQSFNVVLRAVDEAGNLVNSGTISITINNLNDNTPSFSDQSINIIEGLANGSFVSLLEAEDADGNDLTYSILSGNTEEAFTINIDNELQVANESALVFATNPSFTLEIQVSDGTNVTLATFTINLEEITGPTIENQSFTIISTIANGDEVGTISATEPDNLALAFSVVSGNDAGIFLVDESTGVITLSDRTALDFETATTFDLEISVSNSTDEAQATISIVENLAPVFNWTTTTFDFDENSFWFLEVPTTDPEGDELTVTIESGDPGDSLRIGNNAVAQSGPTAVPDLWEIEPVFGSIDYEKQRIFELIIKSEDESGNVTLSDPITITINNLNDISPTFEDQTISLAEGLPNGSEVVTVNGEDLDNDVLTYSIVSGNTDNAFAIEANSGVLSVANTDALAFATNPVFTLVLSTSDGTFSDNATFTINLFEASGPVIADQTFNVISSIETGDEVGTIEAFDAQGDVITYDITSGNENNALALDQSTGVLTVADRSLLDFSTGVSIALTISVSDQTDTNSAQISVVLNTAPIFNWTTTSFEFDENEQWFISIPVTDAESDVISLTITSGDEATIFTIGDVSSGGMSPPAYELFPTAGPIDFEVDQTTFELVIQATDVFTNTTISEAISISILNVNDNTPNLEDATAEIKEGLPNGTLVKNIHATDADNDQLAYFITSGNTSNAFAINAGTGDITVNNKDVLVFATNPIFNLGLSATDGTFSDNAVLTINLLEASGPVIENQTFNIISTIETGNEVGTVEAFDSQGDAITYSITSGNENSAFALDQSTGILTVADRSVLDFSSGGTTVLNVSASDGEEANSAEISVILNTAPTFNWTQTSFEFDENEQWSIPIPVTDAESDELTFTISSGDESSLLTIANSGGAVYELTPSSGSIDFETEQASFDVIIEVEDAYTNTTVSEQISIVIKNINDNAPSTQNVSVNINQNLPVDFIVTTLTATDADGDALSFSIDNGNTDNAFAIDESTGQISVANSNALVFDTNPTFSLTIGVSDGIFTTDATVTINLNEQAVNTAPIIEDQLFEIDENTENGVEIGTIEATDLEGDGLTFKILAGNTNDAFLLTSSGKLLVTAAEMLDFETTPSFTLTVSVSDGEFTEVAAVTVALLDVEETVLSLSDQSPKVMIYPNPASSFFQLKNSKEVQFINVLDESGKHVKSFEVQKSQNYSLEGITPGIYLVQLKTSGIITYERIIIN